MTPFFGPVKATVSGTPGTGAVSPSTAASGYLDFSTVPSNVVLFIRADDGTAWETFYALWNGTTLSRVTVDSSTGSAVSLSSSATVAIVPDPMVVQPCLGTGGWVMANANANASAHTTIGFATSSVQGTAAAGSYSTTNYLTRQRRVQYTSATTTSAPAGVVLNTVNFSRSDTAFMGGFHFRSRWGCSQLPTGPRLFVGVSSSSAFSAEPSTTSQHAAMFAKDSTDTNIQFVTNNASATGNKVDTGIALAANAFYETAIWCAPGAAKLFFYICRLDTGAIYLGSTTTKVPTSDTTLNAMCVATLNGTNTGTAVVLNIQSIFVQTSF